MIYSYLRVSTDKQDYNSQKIGILDFCNRKKWIIDKEIVDYGVSGTKSPQERKLGKLLKKIKQNDIIVCSELSRLGRKLFMIMEILQFCMDKGVKIYTVKENYELGDNIQSKVLAFAFGLSAEIERNLISERTKEGLLKRKLKGFKLGKPKGCKNKHYKLDYKYNYITKSLKSKKSKSLICKKLKCSPTTLNRFIKRNNIHF